MIIFEVIFSIYVYIGIFYFLVFLNIGLKELLKIVLILKLKVK